MNVSAYGEVFLLVRSGVLCTICFWYLPRLSAGLVLVNKQKLGRLSQCCCWWSDGERSGMAPVLRIFLVRRHCSQETREVRLVTSWTCSLCQAPLIRTRNSYLWFFVLYSEGIDAFYWNLSFRYPVIISYLSVPLLRSLFWDCSPDFDDRRGLW